MKKCKVKDLWPGYWPPRCVQQFLTEELDLSEVEWVHPDDPNWDVVIEYGYTQSRFNDDRLSLLFINEPTWDGAHLLSADNIKHPVIYWTLGEESYNFTNCPNLKCISQFCKMYYGGLTALRGDGPWTYSKIQSTDFQSIKQKDISSFVSNKKQTNITHPNCLYSRRGDLILNLISRTKNIVDFFGGWSPEAPCINKWENLQKYKFSIAIENSSESYYMSEKFYDCILQETVPIYYGCTNISELYPNEYGYIQIKDIDDHESVVRQLQYIKKNASEIYAEKLPQILDIRRRYFTELNPLKQILATLKNMGYITNFLSGNDNKI